MRRAFAKQIVHAARVTDPRLEQALAALRREDFLPPGPWQLMRLPDHYQATPTDDPIYLYQDTPVAILHEKGLNNGQPSFLTFLISIGRLQDGERAVHIGTGTGYYTAVISHLAGRNGHVVGIELEPDLASRARDQSPAGASAGRPAPGRFPAAGTMAIGALSRRLSGDPHR